MSIDPKYVTLDVLLQKRLFLIPEYQRAYSWQSKQRLDLFDDIRKLCRLGADRHHFMATIVCLATGEKKDVGSDEIEIFHVVDGQQRLTTLIIMLKALSKALSSIDNENARKEALKLNELLSKEDGKLILLQMNHDSSAMFRKYVKDGKLPAAESAKTAAEKNLTDAYAECERFVKEWDPFVLLKIIKNRLDFIFYVMADEGAVYTIFEVLNSRGLEVDWLDKCKSILMGIAFEKGAPEIKKTQINELHKRWSNIYRTIGIKKLPEHQILGFAATLRHHNEQSKILSAQDSIEFFRASCEKDPAKVIDVTDYLLEIVRKLEKLFSNRRLEAVTDISHARLLAVAIMLTNSLNNNEQKEVLQQWEDTTFRIFGLGRKDSRSKIGNYTRLAQEVMKGKMGKSELIGKIKDLADEDITTVVNRWRGSDCYNDLPKEDLMYFFYRYEEFLASEMGGSISQEIWEQIWQSSPTTTIEHIYPQKPGPEWKGKLGKGPGQLDKNVHRLGNLIVLPPGVNSKAGNKSFKDKKQIYKKHGPLRLLDDIMNKRDWNKATIEKREEELLNWAKETWA